MFDLEKPLGVAMATGWGVPAGLWRRGEAGFFVLLVDMPVVSAPRFIVSMGTV